MNKRNVIRKVIIEWEGDEVLITPKAGVISGKDVIMGIGAMALWIKDCNERMNGEGLDFDKFFANVKRVAEYMDERGCRAMSRNMRKYRVAIEES